MNKLVYAASLVVGCTAASQPPEPVCGDGHVDQGETCDDGNTVGGDGCSATCQTEAPMHWIAATWNLRSLATNGAAPCPTGFPTAALVSQLLDGSGQPVGAPIVDPFTCSAATGTSAALAPGRYRSYIAITDAGGTNTFGQSLAKVVDATAGDAALTVDILVDGGYLTFTWDLVGEESGNSLTCAQAAAMGVDSLSTASSGGAGQIVDTFPCTDGTGMTRGLLAGSYSFSLSAVGSGGNQVGAGVMMTKDVPDANHVADLGAITIPILGL
jgi:cysteine-rich repeat protein